MERIIFILTIILILFFAQCNEKHAEKSNTITYNTYVSNYISILDSAVQTKEKELNTYLQNIRHKAANVQKDKLLQNFFTLQMAFRQLNKDNITPALLRENKRIETSIKKHYIQNYHTFYDILMIDTLGNIFYTIKKEGDFQSNVFSEEYTNTKLSEKLKKQKIESFVDFQFYDVSQEPSAFFIEPVKAGTSHIGWIVLQFSIDRINKIFSLDKSLGATGEVILVNKKHYMLTDSRFKTKTTILKQQLAKENIMSKFAQKKGHKRVTDYRGFQVMSSFEVCSIFSHEWLIIAKINEAEVLTNYFKKYPEKLDSCLSNALKISQHKYIKPQTFKNYINVGIDEYKRSENKPLYTHGISQCTGLVITLPDKTTYLAHISPYDKLYGKSKTDIAGQLLKRINYLEITPAQRHLLEFSLIAPHTNVYKTFINTLLENGIFLNQIRIVHNEKARAVDIFHNIENKETIVHWHMQSNGKVKAENSLNTQTLNKKICI